MSKAKHTPGPWFLNDAGTVILASDRSMRHNAPFPVQVAYTAAMDLVQCRPNAHLIATAPEMAELLETFTTWARQVAGRSDVPQGIRSTAAQLHDDGKRMLVKATGDQS